MVGILVAFSDGPFFQGLMLVPGRVCNHFVLEGAVETSYKIPPKPCGLDCTVGGWVVMGWMVGPTRHGVDGGRL